MRCMRVLRRVGLAAAAIAVEFGLSEIRRDITALRVSRSYSGMGLPAVSGMICFFVSALLKKIKPN
jgi:hypothetical protein